jgi:hypothetical protein
MGGQIGTQPTGAIAGRGSTILEFAWSPPDPADYSSFGGDANHFCLLSRIETAAAAPFGMTFPETSNLYANVQSNNKIVWKNVEVVASGGFDLSGFVTVGNPESKARKVAFKVHAAALAGKHPWGHVELEVPSGLAAKLRAAHLDPAVATFDEDTLRILQLNKPLGPVTLEPAEYFTLGVRIAAGAGAPHFGLFLVDVNQYERHGSDDVLIGGQRVAFERLPPPRKEHRITGKWWHSHEEGDEENQVFRPEGYAFPVSHGRWGFELHGDHTATVLDIAAADGTDETESYWWSDDERIIIGVGDPDRGDIAIRVDSSDETVLTVRRASIDIIESTNDAT